MYNILSNKVADLRDVFPWPEECNINNCSVPEYIPGFDNTEIIHSAEYCTDVMIRISKYLSLKQKAFDYAFKELEAHYPRIAEEFDDDRLSYIQNEFRKPNE